MNPDSRGPIFPPHSCLAMSSITAPEGTSVFRPWRARLHVSAMSASEDEANIAEYTPLQRSVPDVVADFAGDDVAEQMPRLAVELHQLHLLDRKEVVRTGVDLDARQHHVAGEILEICRLLHDVFARQIIAALPEQMDQGLRRCVTVDVVEVHPVS